MIADDVPLSQAAKLLQAGTDLVLFTMDQSLCV